ncbi:protein DBF4 homolog B isoform X1 [Oryctolagus cuniculus]|uniref:protein DBF4 homolog B isoform X1 n=1 Tax=Oryctolagus cuniculus TaxID=9986 RepID=UPI00048BE1BB|nr:protein DBF4 homolog B isoform X1 [Oryctolagus cuniculus]XP_051681743.1 protein DBF4 homolog B isoform X1 [Oryctolagus cuniculus]
MSEPGQGDGYLGLRSSMAETRLRAADLGAQLGVSSCPEKCHKSSPRAGRQPFSGKSFYLDLPAGKTLQFLTGAIQQLGGVIEGFLSKEVSYIVSSRREAKAESGESSPRVCLSPSEVRVETPPMADPRGSHARASQSPADLVPMSRGKELLQKAIRKQGSSSGGGSGSSSSLLTNARSWGVRVLHVDEMLVHVQQLSLGSLCVKKQEPKKAEGTRPAPEARTRKVARLKAPFLKIEDASRKFRPCHHQFKSFPEISFLGPKDASPFEAPRTPGGSQHPRPREPSPRSAARPVPRRKKGYCECCQEAFHELHVHLQSAQHQGFALEAHPYAEVDRIIAQLSHSLADIPFRACLPRRSGGPASVGDPLCAETLPHSEPSHPRATPPMKRSDTCQAPGAPQQAVTVGGVQAPSEPAGTGEASGPGASCQEPEGSLEVFVDPAGTATSRSPACQRPRTNPGVTDLSSGSDSAAVGHKRKVQFPSGSAEKRPGASWPEASFFVPRAPNPGSSRTASGDHLLPLPPPSQEPRSPAAVLPTSCPQACLSFPDPFPWQPTGVWATQPPWPGGGWPPGPADSEQAAPGPVSQRDEPAVPGQLSAAGPRIPGGPAESQSASAPHPLPAGGAASCSRWFWTSPPLQVPCLPVSQAGPQPSAGPELLL